MEENREDLMIKKEEINMMKDMVENTMINMEGNTEIKKI